MPLDPAAAGAERDPEMARYSRQVLFAHVGPERQRMLTSARAAVIGCGALGSALANLLGRAGVGFLRIIDRDYVELNNLQRQVLFDERDIADGLPKAEAAARKLRAINSQIAIEPVVTDVSHANVEPLLSDVQLVLDGSDNLETRFLINDACVKLGLPWVYGACIGATGMLMAIRPGATPCLRCIWPEPPPPGSSETCDTAGILGPTVEMVAALQAVEAMKLLTGQTDAVSCRLTQFDVWRGTWDAFDMSAGRDPDCVCCGRRDFEFLSGRRGSRATVLCGRDAVQVSPPPGVRIDLNAVADKLRGQSDAPPLLNRFLLRFSAGGREVTLFADGRAIVKGTSDADEARSVYAKYVGV